MTSIANGSNTTAENAAGKLQFKFLAHVQSLPVVHDSIDQIYSHPIGRNAGDAIKVVSQSAFKLSGPINPYLAKADSFADSGLSNIENRFPIVKAPTSEIRDKTSGVAKSTVGTYAAAAKDTWQGATSNGHAAGEKIKAQTDGVVSSVQERIDPLLKPVVDTVENILDLFLPKAQQAAKDAKSTAKDVAGDAKTNGTDAKKEAEHQAQRVIDLSFSLLDRSKEKARSSLSYAHETAVSAKDSAIWSLQNPTKVPGAAINIAKEKTNYAIETVDETVQGTRKRAASITDLAFQAKDKALKVFEEEQQAAPKDFPRGLVVSSINTVLRLSKESLDHAKTYFQSEHGEIADKTEEAADKTKDAAKKATDSTKDAAKKASDKTSEVAEKASSKVDDVNASPAVKKLRSNIKAGADTIANGVSK